MGKIDELKAKALSLPLSPGVYLMTDKQGKVIYVGKAKRLKSRVASYFQEGADHTDKTRRMVARVHDFDTIIVSSEFEALVLECSLIKHHQPKYNILLKDGKGYPFIRLGPGPYPRFEIVYKPEKDGAQYFGPYGGHGATLQVVEALSQALKLPVCARAFPRDIGKGRPCLQRHLNRCLGVCAGAVTESDYETLMRRAVRLMEGKLSGVLAELEEKMRESADGLHFEAAAAYRDQIRSISALARRQIVVGGGMSDTDAIACVAGQTRCGVAVLHFMEGNLLGRDVDLVEEPDEDPSATLSSFVSQYYMARGRMPGTVLLSHPVEDTELLCRHFERINGAAPHFLVPKTGKKAELVAMAARNASEEIERVTTREEKTRKLLQELQRLLNLPAPPRRIESVDISNTGESDRVGVVVCYSDGRPLKKAYRQFIIKDGAIRDDYHAMREVLTRRFSRLIRQEEGFSEKPDLLLVDGGKAHASMAAAAVASFALDIPVFGLVKDERHRTRGIISPDGAEADMTGVPALFALLGQIQEETHRAALAFHQKRRSRFSTSLDAIAGVGPARREALLKSFGSLKKIKAADLPSLRRVLPQNAAVAVYNHFHQNERGSAPDGETT